jgi:hypothetical protein
MPPCCLILLEHGRQLGYASVAILGDQTTAKSRWFTCAPSRPNRIAGCAECRAMTLQQNAHVWTRLSTSEIQGALDEEETERGRGHCAMTTEAKLSLSLCTMPWRRIRNVQVKLLAWTLEPDEDEQSASLSAQSPARKHNLRRTSVPAGNSNRSSCRQFT